MVLKEWLWLKKQLDRKYTYKRFSEDLGVSYCYVCRLTEHKNRPSKHLAKKIVSLTNGAVTLDDLDTVTVTFS